MFVKIARIVLGVLLIVFGANKFLNFIPMEQPSGAAGEFLSSLASSGYVFPVIGCLEVVIGLLLVIKKWVPFALVLLAPISINILLYHLFLDIPGKGLTVAIAIAAIHVMLIYKYWSSYRPLFMD